MSPEKFDALADIVVNKSNLKGNISERIEQKLKEAKDRGEPISRDTAYEEVIADSMETILTSGRVLEMMNEVKKQDKTLWEQIRDWFVDFIKSIREAYKGVDADTVEGQAIAEMDDVLKELEQVFAEGLVDAGENFQTAEENTTLGGVKYSQKYLTASTNDGILSLLEKVLKGNFSDSEKVSFGIVPDSIADAITSLTGIDVIGFEMVIEARQVNHIMKDHGPTGAADRSMADPRHLAKIEYTLFNPDEISRAGTTRGYTHFVRGKSRPAPTVLYEKSIGAQSYYVVQAVPDTKARKLYVVSAFIGKSGYKKEASQLINAKGPDATAKTGSVVASNNSIRSNEVIVNPESAATLDISADAKTESVAPSVLKSERTDTDGNHLSEDQQAYFADSMVRDAEGKLQVMYRGDATDVNVFDRKRSRPSNLYGRGFYFTSSKSHAGQYGDARAFYLNIKNPLRPNQHSITKEQMLKFLQTIEDDGEDYDLYNYGENATASSVLRLVWGKGDFEMLQDVSASAIGDLVAAVELFNSINGTDYDGLILPTETVIFQSDQAKLTSNKTPTSNPDVRYSNRDYVKQVDEVKNNTHDPLNHVYMGSTPTSIANVLELPKLPMLITSQHIYSMAVSEAQARLEGRLKSRFNYHNLGWDTVKSLLEHINKPVLIIKSNTDPDDATFVVVTTQGDYSGNPIIAAIKPNGRGNYFNIEFPSNFMLSGYGKDGIRNYVAKAKTENRILYASKRNSQKMQNTPSVQFADNILSSDYTKNLADFKKIVKSKFAGTVFENSGLPKLSNRTTESLSTRSILTNALEGVAQNEWEQNKLNEYKENIAKVEVAGRDVHKIFLNCFYSCHPLFKSGRYDIAMKGMQNLSR